MQNYNAMQKTFIFLIIYQLLIWVKLIENNNAILYNHKYILIKKNLYSFIF